MSPTLVLLHGFTGDPGSWEGIKSGFAPALLGHGDRDPNINTFTEEVDRIASQVAAHGLQGAHLAGYSLGARLALGLMVRHSALFARATLIGVNPGIESDEVRAERARSDQRWIDLLLHDGIERFADEWVSQPLFATQDRLPEPVRARERARRLRHDPHELARSLRVLGLAAMPSYRASLRAISAPVHLIAGGEDPKFVAIAEAIRPLFESATITVVPGCGHNLLLERPALIAEALA